MRAVRGDQKRSCLTGVPALSVMRQEGSSLQGGEIIEKRRTQTSFWTISAQALRAEVMPCDAAAEWWARVGPSRHAQTTKQQDTGLGSMPPTIGEERVG